MAAGHTTMFVVRESADLARVSAWLAHSPRAGLLLDIGDEDGALNEADLRAVFEDAWAARANLSVATDDPLIAEFCRIHGVPLAGEKLRAPAATAAFATRAGESVSPAERAWHDALTSLRLRVVADTGVPPDDTQNAVQMDERPEEDGPTPTSAGGDTVAPPQEPQRYQDSADHFSYSDASFAFVVAPPTPRRPNLPAPATVAPAQALPGQRLRPTARRRRVTVLSTAALLGAVLSVGVILIGFLAPYTTVQLTPLASTIRFDLTYGVAGAAPDLDVAIPPRPLARTVTYEATIPTTGERFEPDLAARGEVLFTNPTTTEAFVPAGTALYSAGGLEYVTTADLTVPAADPFGSLTFGSASVEVVASAAGPDGNLAAEELTGQLGSGIFYSNRAALEGGTQRRIAVVSEADTAALEQQARAALEQRGEADLTAQLNAGEQLVPDSMERGEPQLVFDRQAGADAAQLTVRGTLELRGAAYDPAALHAAAEQELNARLPALVPRGQLLVADSLAVGQPQPLPDGNGLSFQLDGTAQTQAVIAPDQLEAARSALVGANAAEADEVAAAIPGVASSSVEVGPGWLPFGREPRLKSRITIEVVDESSQPAGAAQPTGP